MASITRVPDVKETPHVFSAGRFYSGTDGNGEFKAYELILPKEFKLVEVRKFIDVSDSTHKVSPISDSKITATLTRNPKTKEVEFRLVGRMVPNEAISKEVSDKTLSMSVDMETYALFKRIERTETVH